MEVINAQLPEQMTPQLFLCWFLHTCTAASWDTYVGGKQDTWAQYYFLSTTTLTPTTSGTHALH